MTLSPSSPRRDTLSPSSPRRNDVDLDAVIGLVGRISETPEAASTTWRAEVRWDGAFRSQARVRDFQPLVSDEPPALGGSDAGPNPVEQLLAALGNCLAVGYAANATVAGIDLRDLRIDVEGDLDLHSFLGLRDGHAGFETIRARVHIDADATPDQLDELHRKVTATSPVGHTLAASIPLDVTLA